MTDTLKPNKEAIKAWVDALRSGDYKQGTGTLRVNNSYCCLGVLCDISGLGEWKRSGSNIYSYTVEDDERHAVLPEKVRSWVGVGAQGTIMVSGHQYKDLIDLNDTGVSFKDIAYLIEKEYLIEEEDPND